MRVNPSRLLIALAAALAVAVGCGGSDTTIADGPAPAQVSTTTLPPDPWVEIEDNFLAGCAEADGGATIDGDALADYCRCAYGETVEFYGTAEAFELADEAGEPDPLLARAWEGCAALHLS